MPQPNVVLFIPHDTGRFVSPYGYDTVHTPHCERLAAEGVTLANHFCTTPLCSPSRAAITTGRYPHQNGVMGLTSDHAGAFDLYPSERHLSQILADAGYEGVLCGFEHECRDCTRLGFEHTLAGSGTWFNGGGDLREQPAAIDSWLDQRDATRPFYLQMGCHETHQEWDAFEVEPDTSRGVWMPPYLRDLPEIRAEMAALQGSVRRLDEGLGGLLDVLERRGLADNTIVVFTTDHGIDLPRAKGTFYDAGIGTFGFVRWPAGGLAAGSRVASLTSGVDVLPTLLEAVGVATPDNLAGRSFLPALRSQPYEPRAEVFAEKTYHDTYDPTRVIRTERWAYHRHFEVNIFCDLRLATMTRRHYWDDNWFRGRHEELYELQSDPHSMTNLADSAEHAAVKAELRGRLLAWMRDTNDPLLEGPVSSPLYQQRMAEFQS
ncbi:MAG: sulfatase [Armatimonadetes bacterium]|nr:sulfatase [Armatimonadota bacterium]